MKPGDTVLLLRQAIDRGIVARGIVVSEVFEDSSWNEEDEEEKRVSYVEVSWLQQVRIENVLKLEDLKKRLPRVHWTPFSSGTKVSDEHGSELIKLWEAHFEKYGTSPKPVSVSDDDEPMPASDDGDGRCQICGIEIQSVYGTLPSSALVKAKFLGSDAENVVCRNCYQVAHSFDPPLGFEQLKEKLSINW